MWVQSCKVRQVILTFEQFNLTHRMDFFRSLGSPERQEGKTEKTEVFSGLSSLLKNTVTNKFFTFFDEVVKPALQRNQEEIASNYKKINQFIQEIHEHVQKLLKQHQQDVFEIVREQMKQAYEEVKKLTTQLNKKILLKNQNEEMWHMSNQLDYFKAQALKLFSNNKQLRVQNKLLAKTIKDYEIELESLDHTLQKIKKKNMKNKSIKIIEKPPPNEVKRNSAINIKTKESLQPNKRLATELSSIMRTEVGKQGKDYDDSRLNINIPWTNSRLLLSNGTVSKPFQNSHILITLEDEDKTVENVTIPNFSGKSQKSKKSRHSRNFQASQLFLRERPILQCLDKYTQTDFPHPNDSKGQSISQINSNPKQMNGYELNLSKNGFKFNATNLKTKRIQQMALRSSVDYERNKGIHIRSMNNSFLRNRLQDSFATSHKKKGGLFKQSNFLPAK